MSVTRKIALMLRRMGLEEGITWILERMHLNVQNIKVVREGWAKNPTPEMKTSKLFFEQNSEMIERNVTFFADEKSKEIYKKMIRFRQTYNKNDAPTYTWKDQYFVKDIISLSKNEIFVDCGAYNGDTISAFIKLSGGEYKRIVALEADKMNYEYIKNKANKQKWHSIDILNYGVWNKEEELTFSENGSPGSMISEGGNAVIQAKPLDKILECQEATFVKMDIEGAEKNALEGMKTIIERKHPKLAICIYHSDSDMLEIPNWIHSNYPFYKLFVRQHHYLPIETVLYAVP